MTFYDGVTILGTRRSRRAFFSPSAAGRKPSWGPYAGDAANGAPLQWWQTINAKPGIGTFALGRFERLGTVVAILMAMVTPISPTTRKSPPEIAGQGDGTFKTILPLINDITPSGGLLQRRC